MRAHDEMIDTEELCDAALASALAHATEPMPAESCRAVRERLLAAIAPAPVPLHVRLLRPIAVLATAAVVMGGVSYAAAASAPGDLLFPLKRSVAGIVDAARHAGHLPAVSPETSQPLTTPKTPAPTRAPVAPATAPGRLATPPAPGPATAPATHHVAPGQSKKAAASPGSSKSSKSGRSSASHGKAKGRSKPKSSHGSAAKKQAKAGSSHAPSR